MIVTVIQTSILLILFSTLVDAQGLFLNGSIRPHHLVLTENPLNISCSLPSVVNIEGVNITSENLYFMPEELIFSSATVIDELTINVTLKNISRFYNHVNIFCYANVSGVTHKVAQNKIVVIEPLSAPTFKECIVYDWREMVCTWKPMNPDFGIKTDVQFFYSINCLVQQFSLCLPLKPGRCEFKSGSFHMTSYCVIICFNHTGMKACTNITLVETARIVKPGRVEGVQLVRTNSRWVELKLEKSREDIMFYLEVNVGGENRTIKSKDNYVRLDNLRPHTAYKLSVKCIPLLKAKNKTQAEVGHFSDPYVFPFETLPDVPDENPKLIPGFFHFGSSITPDGKTYAHIIWKKIPFQSENGRLNHTSISYREYTMRKDDDDGDEGMTEEMCDSSDSSVQLKRQLDRWKDYIVEVKLFNEIGSNPNIQPSRIIIPSLNRAPKSPDHFYATLVNNSIQLKWSEVKDAENYSIYWCHLHHSTKICQPHLNIEWKSHIPPETTELKVPTTSDNLDLRVGISVEKFDSQLDCVVSSGVMWARCIHKDVAGVLPPQNLHQSPDQQPQSLTILWSHPECSDTSYVSNYEIFWCKRISDDCDDNNITECCLGNSSVLLPQSLTSWTIEGLEVNSMYEVRVRSRSFDRTSRLSEAVREKIHESGYSKASIIMIIIVVVLLIIFCPFIIVIVVQKTYKSCKDCKKSLDIKIPEGTYLTDYNLYNYTVAPTTDDKEQIEDTPIDYPATSSNDGDEVVMVEDPSFISNGGPGHSGISVYTSVVQASPSVPPNQVHSEAHALSSAEPREMEFLIQSRPIPFHPSPSIHDQPPSTALQSSSSPPPDHHGDDGEGDDDDDDEGRLASSIPSKNKAKANVYV